jgi:hypothetical protein
MPGYRRAYRTVRRLWPLALAAKRRWDDLEEHEKELYKERARKYAKVASDYARDAASRTPIPRSSGTSGSKRGTGTSGPKRSSRTSGSKRSSRTSGAKRSGGTSGRKPGRQR